MSPGVSDAPNREQDFEEKAGAFEYHTSKMIDAAEQTSIHGKNVSKQLTDNIQAAAKDVSKSYVYADNCITVMILYANNCITVTILYADNCVTVTILYANNCITVTILWAKEIIPYNSL